MIKEFIKENISKDSDQIAYILFNKEGVNEFKIAEKLDLTINQTRNILYRLSNLNVMESTRKKDKKKGWYTYFWTLNIIKTLRSLAELKEKEIGRLQKMLKSRQMKSFYLCQTDNIEMTEEAALHHNFLCPECGQLLQPVPKEKILKEINSKIAAKRRKITLINEQLIKLELEEQKEREKEIEKKKKKKKKRRKKKKIKEIKKKEKKVKVKKPKAKSKLKKFKKKTKPKKKSKRKLKKKVKKKVKKKKKKKKR